MLTRTIPSTHEQLPVIGLGTWQTFDLPNEKAYAELKDVLMTMSEAGGTLIDSSPMYGRSEQVVGDIAKLTGKPDNYFYATKVWTKGLKEGIHQMENSMLKMRRKKLDLIQIHNLVDWQTHLPLLQQWKESGKVRYIGITHYTDSSHEELEKLMRTQKIDFVQFNYSIIARNAEKRLLNAAADLGIATIINRPFGEGDLFKKVKGIILPEFAKEIGINTWSAYFLKYIIAHPAVTCVIPATGNPAHAADNFYAGDGELPDRLLLQRMVDYISN